MNYWEGLMNWEIDTDWKCETCGEYRGLQWGMVHAQCRCVNCHSEYTMRADDKERTILTIPRSLLKEEYKEPARKAWAEYHTPLDELTDGQWEEFMEVIPCQK